MPAESAPVPVPVPALPPSVFRVSLLLVTPLGPVLLSLLSADMGRDGASSPSDPHFPGANGVFSMGLNPSTLRDGDRPKLCAPVRFCADVGRTNDGLDARTFEVVRTKAAGGDGTGVRVGTVAAGSTAICCLKYPKIVGIERSKVPPPLLPEDPISLAIVSA